MSLIPLALVSPKSVPCPFEVLSANNKSPPLFLSFFMMVAKKKATKVKVVSVRPRGVKKKNSGPGRGSMQRSGVLSDPRARAWDQLLRDPCSANLTQPCYGGMDNGYLIRTVDYVTPAILGTYTGVGLDIQADYVVQYSPFNTSTSTGLVSAGGTSGGSLSSATTSGLTNFITAASGPVKRFRPVACCVKWLPSGQYSKRAGIVNLGYSPGSEIAGAFSIGGARSLCQHYSTNGSEVHEVRWLPTAVDENFTDTATTNTAAGAIFIVLDKVDAVTTSTTTATLSGSVEITVVWEWVPALQNSVAVSPKAPLPYTSQQVLGTIEDLGAFVFHGARVAATAAGRGLMTGAVRGAMKMLTGGYGVTGTRAPPMMLTY